MIRRTPRTTRTDTLLPDTTLFRAGGQRRIAVDQGHARRELRPRDGPLRRAHRLGRRHRRDRQPHKGSLRPSRAVRQHRPRPARDHRSPDRGGLPVSVTAPAGFTANVAASGIKPSGDLDLSLVPTTDGTAVNAAAGFTQNKITPDPGVTTA